MELKIKDVMEILDYSEKKINQLIKEHELPAYKINGQYRFSRTELHDWILRNHIHVSDKIIELFKNRHNINLLKLINQGGIFYNIQGHNLKTILNYALNVIPIPADIIKNDFLNALLAREDLVPTSIGNGIAIPHPRNPIITETDLEQLSLCFLENPIDYKALDAKPVHSIFITLSSTPRRHLEISSKLSYLCQQEEFINLLKAKAHKDSILLYIERKEKEWENRVRRVKGVVCCG